MVCAGEFACEGLKGRCLCGDLKHLKAQASSVHRGEAGGNGIVDLLRANPVYLRNQKLGPSRMVLRCSRLANVCITAEVGSHAYHILLQ